MKPNDNLEETIRQKLSFSASDKLHDNILNDVLNAQEKAIEALSKALEIIPDLDFAQKVLKLAKKAKNEELKKQ